MCVCFEQIIQEGLSEEVTLSRKLQGLRKWATWLSRIFQAEKSKGEDSEEEECSVS